MKLDKMETETRNANTMDIDNCSSLEIVEKINREDAQVAEAVGKKKEQIAEIIDKVSERMKKGGRKSFRFEEIDLDYEINVKNGFFIHYLEKIQKDLEERN